jgi:hypothetical protein
LEKASEFDKKLEAEGKTDLLQRHRRVVGSILQKSKTKNIQTEGAEGYGDWKVQTAGHILSSNVRDLLSVLSRTKFYTDKDKKTLHTDLIKAIQDIQNEKNSYKTKMDLLNKEIPTALSQLKVQRIENFDEYFFMVDRVFTGDISPQEMLIVFENSNGDLKRLAEVSRKYIEGQLLSLVYESNVMMAARLNESDVYANKIWSESYIVGDRISQSTLSFLRKNENVRSFVDSAYQKQSLNSPKELVSFFTSVRPNLKLILTYPQMLAIGYLMAERNFQGSIRTFWGEEVKITPSMILQAFFQGIFAPWFQYGHDDKRLTPNEVLVAMEFALKTQAFKVLNIPAEKFYNKIFSTLLEVHNLESQGVLGSISNTFRTGTWANIQKVCSYLPGDPKVPTSFTIDTLRDYPAGDLANQFGEYFYLYNEKYTARLIIIEYVQKPVQRRLVALGQSFQTFLKESGESEAEVAKKTNFVMEPIRELQKTQDRYIAEMLRIQKEYDNCFSMYAKYNQDLKHKLLSYEAEYLREIHSLMKQARENRGKVDLNKLNESAKFYKIQGFNDFQSFNEDFFKYSYPDFFLRLKYYIEKGLKTSTKNLPAVQPYFKILMGDSPKASTAMQIENFEKVNWEDDPNIFVANAMRVLRLSDNSRQALTWYLSTTSSNFRNANSSVWMWSSGLSTLYNISSTGEGEPKSLELGEILSYGERVERAFGISPEEEKWRKYLGTMDKLMVNFAQEILINVDNNQTLPPFEYLAKYFGLANTGPSHLSLGDAPPNLYDEASAFYLEVSQPKQYTFDTKFAFYDKLTEIYKKEIQRMDVRTNAFLEGLEKKYRDDMANNKVLTPSFNLGSRYSGPYVSEGYYKSLKSRNTIFHQSTNNAFKK